MIVKKLPRLLAHAAIILTLFLLTLLVFDYFNPSMDFINNAITKGVLIVYAIVCCINAFFVFVATRRGR